MEKRIPHYSLALIKAEVSRSGPSAFTKTALDGGRDIGLTSMEMIAVIGSLSRSDFYKSMTSYANHQVWQDVYHKMTPVGKMVYIKLSLQTGKTVIQFKEK